MTDQERSPLEQLEQAEAEAFAALPKARKLAGMVDALLTVATNQVKHNAPVSPDMVKQLEAIRSLLT